MSNAGRAPLEFTLADEAGVRYVEGPAGLPLMRTIEDARLVVEECFARRAKCALLYAPNLTEKPPRCNRFLRCGRDHDEHGASVALAARVDGMRHRRGYEYNPNTRWLLNSGDNCRLSAEKVFRYMCRNQPTAARHAD